MVVITTKTKHSLQMVLPRRTLHQASQFDESSALRTTYLGKVEKSREDVLKVHEQFSPTYQSATMGTLLYYTDCKIFLDKGASMSFMSKQYCLRKIQFKSKRYSSCKWSKCQHIVHYSYYHNNSGKLV